uniref:Uncharacterized protein n=1 Tax=Meloidogyne enterolobii TaxID=390850 RepID=A0A6V7V8L7_MELEN|nr:unnamed protein product [Meloidogyne enterolobii]
MAYLNIILLLFLFTNFCLFQLTCGCVGKNIGGCNDKDNRCCPGLDCKTKGDGSSICRPYGCINNGDKICNKPHDESTACCYGRICSFQTGKCVTCLPKDESCGDGLIKFKCCWPFTVMMELVLNLVY